MRRGHRKMWWVLPCTSRKSSLRTESQRDIEEILKTELATIKEEPEMCEDQNRKLTKHHHHQGNMAKKRNKILTKATRHGLKHSYVLFMSGFASKARLGGGLSRC